MGAFALVVHRQRGLAASLAQTIAEWLAGRGHEVRLPSEDAEVVGRPDLAVPEEKLGVGLDLAVSIGGDGTMLRTVDMVAVHEAPVIGVNVGQLGYLTEVEPADWEIALERFLRGEFQVDQRMLLRVHVDAPSGASCSSCDERALNEAVLEKTPMGHTVRLKVLIDGDFFTTYAADGLIVGTPTGSTAYAFSARGPIVDPSLRALLLTPVSPHMLFDRTMVLDPRSELRLEVDGHRAATLSVDGRNLGELVEGDAIVCTAGEQAAHLVTFGGRDFHRILKAKFGLNDR
jgi:NAD+ kinase